MDDSSSLVMYLARSFSIYEVARNLEGIYVVVYHCIQFLALINRSTA